MEINALWHNALLLLADWHERDGRAERAAELRAIAARTRESFNRRFWDEAGGYLYDVVDGEHGDDPACRLNQILSFALHYPVLDQSKWQAVLEVVRSRLLTPLGLRSLDPGHPDYKAQYFGDLRARDGAYHQGTVWAWLIGPFIDAWLAAHLDRREEAFTFLHGFLPHLDEACDRSARFSMPRSPTRRAGVWRKRGVSPRSYCWVKTATAQQAADAASHLAEHGATVPGLAAK